MTRLQFVRQPPRGLRDNFKASGHGIDRAQTIVKGRGAETSGELGCLADMVKMSRSAGPAGLEGIDGVRRRGGTDIGFQSIAAHNIHGGIKELCDIAFQSGKVDVAARP